MARIPMGNFDSVRVQAPVITGSPGLSGALAEGRAMEGLGNTISDTAMRFQQAQQQKIEQDEQEDKALKRVRALNATATYELQVKQAAVDVQSDLSTGNATWSDAPEKFQSRLSTIVPAEIEGMDPVLAEQYNGGIQQTRAAAGMLLDSSVREAKREDGRGQWIETLDKFGKLAGMPGADIDKINGVVTAAAENFRAFELDPAVLKKQAQDFADRNWTNHALNASNVVDNDLAGLQKLRTDLTDDKGHYATRLDPEKRVAIARQVGDRIDAIEAKDASRADRLEKIQAQTIDRIDTQLASGFPPTKEQRAAWAETFPAGSPMRAEYEARVAGEDDAQTFLRLPIAQQISGLRAEEARLRTQGADPADQRNFLRKQKIVQANVKLLTEQPLQFASSYMDTPIVPITPDVMADPEQGGKLGAMLQQRAATIGALRKQFGPQVRETLLTPEEASAMTAVLASMPSDVKVSSLGKLAAAVGSENHFEAMMRQLAPDSPVTARAGVLASINRRFRPGGDPVSGNVALTMLRGEEQLNKSKQVKATDGKATPFPMPPDKDIRAAFGDAVGDVFAGDVADYEEALQWTRAYYAGRMIEAGKLTDEPDERLVKEAVRATFGTITEFNDRKTPIPFGFDEDDFSEAARVQVLVALSDLPPVQQRNAATAAQLLRLENGVYALVNGEGMMLKPNGRPRVIRVRK